MEFHVFSSIAIECFYCSNPIHRDCTKYVIDFLSRLTDTGTSTCTPTESRLTDDLESRLLSRRRLPNRQRFLEEQKAQGESRVLERFQTREWKAGDVYAPHDLSPAEMKKWSKRHSPNSDAFDALNMNPLDQYKVS